ncbi:MAG: phenylacetate-CoA oxygenase subunit PaaC [Acidobacteria bacterium]|nr:phenylacetate-CoA oxygenase subunit PaaC [Acidobacteriota bacterium]
MKTTTTTHPLVAYILRHADDNLVMGQRLAEYVTRAPELEEDLAIGNLSLDHIGVAMHLYGYAATLSDDDITGDDLAFLRSEREFSNTLLVEQPHNDFGEVMARQFFFAQYQVLLWECLSESTDETLAGIAQKALKEATYHVRHASGWVIRLGDGTDDSHARMQAAIDAMWRFTGELFENDTLVDDMVAAGIGADQIAMKARWDTRVDAVLTEATLDRPQDPYQATGGRNGIHTEYLGHMLAEMQWMQRTHPGLQW